MTIENIIKINTTGTVATDTIRDVIIDTMAEHEIKLAAAAHIAGVKLAVDGTSLETVEKMLEIIVSEWSGRKGREIGRAFVKGWEAIARA